MSGAPGRTRTDNSPVRSRVLSPVEVRGLVAGVSAEQSDTAVTPALLARPENRRQFRQDRKVCKRGLTVSSVAASQSFYLHFPQFAQIRELQIYRRIGSGSQPRIDHNLASKLGVAIIATPHKRATIEIDGSNNGDAAGTGTHMD